MNPPFPSSLEAVQAASQALHQPGATLEDVTQPVETLLLNAIENQPRSLQKRIGPSEIGTECDHCLAAKLAGWEENSSGIPWASTVGTAIHALLENFVNNHQAQTWNPHTDPAPPPTRYFTEQTVTVGTIAGEPITGSIDLLDVQTGTTVDWKAVNPTRLRAYRTRGPSQVYRVQAHLYAKGCNDAGIPVNRVSICFLPRGSNNFFERHWWSEPYNPQIADDALTRANQISTNLAAIEALGVEARDKWITSLPRADGCYSCRRYPDSPPQTQTLGGIEIDLPTTNKK